MIRGSRGCAPLKAPFKKRIISKIVGVILRIQGVKDSRVRVVYLKKSLSYKFCRSYRAYIYIFIKNRLKNVSSEEERFSLALQIIRVVTDIPSSIAEVGRILKTMIKSFESKHLTPRPLESLNPLLQLNWRRKKCSC
jgi:hypothetical protein